MTLVLDRPPAERVRSETPYYWTHPRRRGRVAWPGLESRGCRCGAFVRGGGQKLVDYLFRYFPSRPCHTWRWKNMDRLQACLLSSRCCDSSLGSWTRGNPPTGGCATLSRARRSTGDAPAMRVIRSMLPNLRYIPSGAHKRPQIMGHCRVERDPYSRLDPRPGRPLFDYEEFRASPDEGRALRVARRTVYGRSRGTD